MPPVARGAAKVYSFLEVKRQEIEISITELTNVLNWTTFRHPDEATIPLSALRDTSEFNRFIPANLGELEEDYGVPGNEFELLLGELMDYKSIPLCTPLVSRILVLGDVRTTISNPEGVKLWETMKQIYEVCQAKEKEGGFVFIPFDRKFDDAESLITRSAVFSMDLLLKELARLRCICY